MIICHMQIKTKKTAFFWITCNESHLLNYFSKKHFLNEKIQIEREQYPVRKRGQLSPELLKK